MILRPYQSRIAESIGDSNAIVKMPTGSGKTYIGIELIKRCFRRDQSIQTNLSFLSELLSTDENNRKQYKDSIRKRKAIFLVPSCDLVTQQANVIREWGFCTVAEYMGGAKSPDRDVDVIVSTPQAFILLQDKEYHPSVSQNSSQKTSFAWENICICVFDEVHHALKDHPYRRIALRLQDWNSKSKIPLESEKITGNDRNPFEAERSAKIQVIGLSASLTYSVEDTSVHATLNRLCSELGVEKMECPSSEELREGGYIAATTTDNKDISCLETIKVDDIPEGVIPVRERQVHLMHEMFFRRIYYRRATPFAQTLAKTVQAMEKQAKEIYKDFVTPTYLVKLTSWETYAHDWFQKIKSSNLDNIDVDWLYTPKQGTWLFKLLEIYYVALRMTVQSWEEGQSLVSRWLHINEGFLTPPWINPSLRAAILELKELTLNENIMKHEKIKSLRKILLEKKKMKNKFRGIVFVQQRITAYILSHFIKSDPDLLNSGIKAGFVTARQSRLTPSIKVNKTEAAEELKAFKEGKINLLFATSVIEEGFDVPEANVVISYDHLKDSVELCQRFGRARAEESSIVVMAERVDRPISRLEEVRQRQDLIIEKFDPANLDVVPQINIFTLQNQRENSAGKSILSNEVVCTNSPLHALKMYVDKTKAVLNIDIRVTDRCFKSSMRYKSPLRDIEVSKQAGSKKKAKIMCATEVLQQLRVTTTY